MNKNIRIVSLLPSATEIICQLGLTAQLVGVTHECDYPSFVRELPKVTKTLIPHEATSGEIDRLVRERLKSQHALYSLDMPTLERLKPDLIVTQALCDVCAVAESEVNAAACQLPGKPRVINLEPSSLHDVFQCVEAVGDAAGISDRASDVISQLQARVDAVIHRTAQISSRPRVVLLEWIDPPFSSGHWSPELIRMAGGTETVGTAGERSRTLDWQSIINANPDFLIISCCGFDIDRTLVDLPILVDYPNFASMKCVKARNVYVVDGNAYFSRPGPRLVDSLELIANTLHPEVHPLPKGLIAARRLTNHELTPSKSLNPNL